MISIVILKNTVVQLSRLMMVNPYFMMMILLQTILYITSIMTNLMNGYLSMQSVDTHLTITRIGVDT
nr:MAG TPA: hypothetical protein [Caudoviricetes sp.]